MITLEPMLVGAEIPFSVDMAAKIPAGATLSSATVSVLSGGTSVTVDRVTVSGTAVVFWVKALVAGTVSINMLAAFSDTSDDGERIEVRVI